MHIARSKRVGQDARLLTVFVCGICVTWIDGLCRGAFCFFFHWGISLIWTETERSYCEARSFEWKGLLRKSTLKVFYVQNVIFSRMEMLKSWWLYPTLCVVQRTGKAFMTIWCSWFSAYMCTDIHIYMYIFHIHMFIYTHTHLDDLSICIYDVYGMYMTVQLLTVVKCC